jgi:hypothetical protein
MGRDGPRRRASVGDLLGFARGESVLKTQGLTRGVASANSVSFLLTPVERFASVFAQRKNVHSFAQFFAQEQHAMALKVKDINASASKFVARAGIAGPAYTAGIQAAGTSQNDNAIAAAPAWAAGVQQAAANNSFAKGLQRVGPTKWQTNAANKGAKNYPAGVAAAQSAYTTGVTPYFQVLANLNLTPRAPRGDPRNQQRSVDVQTALHAKKVSG